MNAINKEELSEYIESGEYAKDLFENLDKILWTTRQQKSKNKINIKMKKIKAFFSKVANFFSKVTNAVGNYWDLIATPVLFVGSVVLSLFGHVAQASWILLFVLFYSYVIPQYTKKLAEVTGSNVDAQGN